VWAACFEAGKAKEGESTEESDLASKNQPCNFAAFLMGGWCTAPHASEQGY